MKSIRTLLLTMVAVLLLVIPVTSMALTMDEVEDRYTYQMQGEYIDEFSACFQPRLKSAVNGSNHLPDLKDLLYYEALGDPMLYTYTWQPAAILVNDADHFIDELSQPTDYWSSQTSAYWFLHEDVGELTGKALFTCTIADQEGNVITNVDFVMSGMDSEPHFEHTVRNVYFNPGESYTFTCPEPIFYGGKEPVLSYQLLEEYTEDNGDYVQLLKRPFSGLSSSRSYTVTLKEEHDRTCLLWGYKKDGDDGVTYTEVRYNLISLANDPIIMPEHENGQIGVFLEKGQNHTISFPAASGSRGKVVYNWICYGQTMDGEWYEKDLGYTDKPSLTLTYHNAVNRGTYMCRAGYEGDDLKDFEYYELETQIYLTLNTRVVVEPATTETAFTGEIAENLGAETFGELIEKEMTPVFEMYTEEDLSKTDIIPVMITLQTEEGEDVTDEYFEKYTDLKVKIPMPEGYSWDTHRFIMIHTFSHDSASGAYMAGESEICPGYNEDDGMITFYVTGLSPVAIYAVEDEGIMDENMGGGAAGVAGESNQELPRTGDSTPIAMLEVLMMLSAAGCVLMSRKRA